MEIPDIMVVSQADNCGITSKTGSAERDSGESGRVILYRNVALNYPGEALSANKNLLASLYGYMGSIFILRPMLNTIV